MLSSVAYRNYTSLKKSAQHIQESIKNAAFRRRCNWTHSDSLYKNRQPGATEKNLLEGCCLP
jgi:hypothetical protein